MIIENLSYIGGNVSIIRVVEKKKKKKSNGIGEIYAYKTNIRPIDQVDTQPRGSIQSSFEFNWINE